MRKSNSHLLHYQILESHFPVFWLFGHNMIVLRDPYGEIIGEMEGLATSHDGKIKPIGYWKSDRLKVYEFSAPYLYRPHQSQQILYEGTEAEILRKWHLAREAKHRINELDLPYPFLGMGDNSNSVVSTLIAYMGLVEPELLGARWAPSKGKNILS